MSTEELLFTRYKVIAEYNLRFMLKNWVDASQKIVQLNTENQSLHQRIKELEAQAEGKWTDKLVQEYAEGHFFDLRWMPEFKRLHGIE